MGIVKDRLIKRLANQEARIYPELKLKNEDPVKWNILYWRLLGIVSEGRETARLISASPTVREFGECVFAIFTPDGESIAFSRGILLHMASMGSAIEWMLQHDYEELAGFNPGDIYYNNDPEIGGAHSADAMVLLPVFYHGELVAWVSGLTHCNETGATEPGGQAPAALSRYDDGQMIPCMKVGRDDNFDYTYQVMIERNTRDPKWWVLDDRAKLAGCLKMREALISLFDEYGRDYFMDSTIEMIEAGREAALQKIKQVMFPGTYKMAAFNDAPYGKEQNRMAKDWMMLFPLTMTVGAGAKLNFDWTGTSSPGDHSNNASFPCTKGHHIYSMLQDVLYDTMYNNGMAYSFDLNVPEHCCINPGKEYATAIWTAIVSAIVGAATPCVSRSNFAMGYREEGFASKAQTGAMGSGGIDQFGNQYAMTNFEYNSSGMGASSNLDGLYASNAMWNPESNLSDVEVSEATWPLMWLGRGVIMDGGGFGKHQGGAALESLYVVEHDAQLVLAGAISAGDAVFNSPGLMGGYPAPARYRHCLVDTDYKEKIDQQLPIPHGEGDDPSNPEFAQLLNGTLHRTPAQAFYKPYQRYDIIHQFSGGGGGWGDPLERDPEKVKETVDQKLTSRRSAEKVYGVVLDSKGNVNAKKTTDLRAKIRKQRLERGVPTKQYLDEERKKVHAGALPPLVKETLNDCMNNADSFRQEYIDFWNLPQDFKGF